MIAAAEASFGDIAPFHVHLDIVGVAFALIIGYELGLKRLRAPLAPRGEVAVTTWQRFFFYAGVASLALVSAWPVHDIGERSLFMFHMTEHLVLSLVTPPLLLLGTPWWLLRALLRPALPLLRVLTKPIVALVAFNATLGLLHAPGVVDAMLASSAFHFVAHAALFTTAVLMWFPVIDPIPDLPELQPFGKMGYLFLQSLVPTVPASFLTLGDSPLYRVYETFPRLWGISAHTDQVIAGLIMKLGGGLILWTAIAWVFFSWYAEEQRFSSPRRVAG
ncbi:MAG TPA: cytochrome c oxidase assembly protein [Acidimicrobiia bacterium]|jgi:putative membrane protein